MPRVREVAFELECFEWADERLEVAGRWQGVGQHRLNRPVLTVDTGSSKRKRIAALPGGQLAPPGETWRASFSWPGDPGEITGAELEVGGNLVVELPLPDKKRRRRRRSGGEQHTDEILRSEAAALRGQVERLRAELAGRERELIELRAQLDEAAGADGEEPERAQADDRTVEIQRLEGELQRLRDQQQSGADELTVEIQRLSAERDAARGDAEAALEAERARWQEDIDELRQAFSDAAAEAEEVRDRHRAELAALEEQLRIERAEVARLTAELAARDERDATAAWARHEPDDAGERAQHERDVADDRAARERAAAPPTEPMVPPVGTSTAPPVGSPIGEGPAPPVAASGADAGVAPASSSASGPVPDGSAGDDATIEGAVLDAPGPLRAAARPSTAPGEEVPQTPLAETEGSSAFHALRARFEGLFGSNGDHADEDSDEQPAVPRPLRSASAARARAGTAVAARRSPGEVWATRVLAALVVAVLLTAFVLIVAYIA